MAKPKRLGHVFLWVRDVQRSEEFYTNVLGLRVTKKTPGKSVFLSAAGDSSHELALGQIGMEAPGPEPGRVGLYHFAWEMESFDELKEIYQDMKGKKANIVGIGDHGTSMGVYLKDPDGNECEVFYELPMDQLTKDGEAIKSFPGSLEDREEASVS